MAALSLVVAAAIALQLAMHATLRSLERSRDLFYAESRFSHVFATARRLQPAVLQRLAALPGVAAVAGRIDALAPVLLPGTREPATLHLAGLPDWGLPALDRPVLLEGRLPRPHADDEILLARALAGDLVAGERVVLWPGDLADGAPVRAREAVLDRDGAAE